MDYRNFMKKEIQKLRDIHRSPIIREQYANRECHELLIDLIEQFQNHTVIDIVQALNYAIAEEMESKVSSLNVGIGVRGVAEKILEEWESVYPPEILEYTLSIDTVHEYIEGIEA